MSMFNRRPLTLPTPLAVASGGHSSTNPAAARAVLGMAGSNQLDQPNGLAQLDSNGRLHGKYFEQLVEVGSSISTGDLISMESDVLVIQPGQTILFNITDFDSFTEYVVTTTIGAVIRSNTQITYSAPATIGTGVLNLNGREIQIQIKTKPAKPTLSFTQAVGAGQTINVTLNGTAFSVVGGTTHANTDWQIASNNTFTNIVSQSLADAVGKVSKTFTGLTAATTYYARARYRDSSGSESEWSNTLTVLTMSSQLAITNVSTPVNVHQINGEAVGTSVTVTPSNNGNYTYQWQRYNGSSWVNYGSPVITSNASNVLMFDNNSMLTYDNSFFRCVVSNSVNSMTTGQMWYKQRTVEIGSWLKGRTISSPDNFAAAATTYYAGFWAGDSSGNQAAYVDQLWPNNTGPSVVLKITPPLSSDNGVINNIDFQVGATSYTVGNSYSLISEISGTGYYFLSPGTNTGQALPEMNKLTNNGAVGVVRFNLNTVPRSKSYTYNILERVIPAGWAFSPVTGGADANPINRTQQWWLRTTTGFATQPPIDNSPLTQVVSGSLPPGIAITLNDPIPSGSHPTNSKMAIAEGQPTTVGTYNFTIRVKWNPIHTTTPYTDYAVSVTVN